MCGINQASHNEIAEIWEIAPLLDSHHWPVSCWWFCALIKA